MICCACHQNISYPSELINCTHCKDTYHYACLNITSANYMKNKHNYEKYWKCPNCENVTRRKRNDDTPVKQTFNDALRSTDDNHINDILHITKAEGNTSFNHNNTEVASRNDKRDTPTYYELPNLNTDTVTLENLSTLLDLKLNQNNQTILNDLRKTIHSEINEAIAKLKHEITGNTDTLFKQQNNQQKQIELLNTKIEKLQQNNMNLQHEIKQIQNKIHTPTSVHVLNENSKKIVLYGLTEYCGESENDLFHRAVNVFLDFLSIDLSENIEDIRRLGKQKNNYQRPVVIELLSKRTTNYILKNSTCFMNTGIYVSEYLNETALRENRIMRTKLREARRNGMHAIIRNKKLIVNGKIIGPPFEEQEQLSTQHAYRHIVAENSQDTIRISNDNTGMSQQQNETIDTFRKSYNI